MKEVSFRGGAHIGWMNASWPFANLTANTKKLTLSCLGTYEFSPSQVVSIEPHGSIPILASGLRIRHNRNDYPEKMIFWSLGSRNKMLEEIRQSGFIPCGTPATRPSGFAVRWSVLIGVFVLWNTMLFLDILTQSKPSKPGLLSFIAILSLFALSTAVRISTKLQSLVLQKGHKIEEIKSVLILLQIVSAFMSAALAAVLIERWLTG